MQTYKSIKREHFFPYKDITISPPPQRFDAPRAEGKTLKSCSRSMAQQYGGEQTFLFTLFHIH